MIAARSYLDYNAAAPLRPSAAQAMAAAAAIGGNASSVHAEGRRARRIVEDARADVAALIGAAPDAVIFTSGGTEANAAALAQASPPVISAIEHDSVADARKDAVAACVDRAGRIRLDAAPALASGALLSLMAANNETGVIQPVAEAAAIARAAGALFHCDAAQVPGKIACDDLDADLITLSSYKIGGPAGVGALVVRPGIPFAPLLRGGGQEGWRRAGGENLIGIAGFAAAARAVIATGVEEAVRMRRLRDRFEVGVAACAPAVEIIGRDGARLPNTSCLVLPESRAEMAVMAFDLAGVAISAGAACSSGKMRPSRVLMAMGRDEATAARAIRISFGWASVEADVERALAALATLPEIRRAAA